MKIRQNFACSTLVLLLVASGQGSEYTGRVTNVQLTDFFVPIFSDIKVGDPVHGEFSASGILGSSDPNILIISRDHLTVNIGQHSWDGYGYYGFVYRGDVNRLQLFWDADLGYGTFPYAQLLSTMGIDADEQIGGAGNVWRHPWSVASGGENEDYRIDFSVGPIEVPVPEPISFLQLGLPPLLCAIGTRRRSFNRIRSLA